MKLENSTVFITGGGSGIGLALAEAFLARRAVVVICGRDQSKLETACERNPGLLAFRCDVADEQDLRAAVRRLEADFPALNILVNNAGILEHPDFTSGEADWPSIEREIAIDFLAPVRLAHALLPRLLQKPGAAILNISSALALAPLARAPIYCASKAALHSFSISLRRQLASTNVKVFEALTPLVDTAMAARQPRWKMPPERFARQVLRNMERDRYEMAIGAAKALGWMMRLAPETTTRLLNVKKGSGTFLHPKH